jgi:hypothetical protein
MPRDTARLPARSAWKMVLLVASAAAAVVEEAEADEVVAGYGEFGFGGGGVGGVAETDDAAVTAEAGGYVEVAVDVEGHALGAAEASVVDGGVAVWIDGVDVLVGADGGGRNHEDAVGTEAEVVEGGGWLEGGEDEDLTGAVGIVGIERAAGLVAGRSAGNDLEDGAGAVADEEVAARGRRRCRWRCPCLRRRWRWRPRGDAVDGAFGAGAGVEIAVGAKGERGDVDQIARAKGGLAGRARCGRWRPGPFRRAGRRPWRRGCRRRRPPGWR